MVDVDVSIVGDGPCGLSAALLLAKNDLSVRVFGLDETAMHSAYLYNYLGIDEIDGDAFMERARKQSQAFGVDLVEAEVTDVGADGDAFEIETSDGDGTSASYLVLATGRSRELASALDLSMDDKVIDVDRNGRTSVQGCYAGGWATRAQKIQAAISVGDGAAIALDILSKEAGEPVHDFDVPP